MGADAGANAAQQAALYKGAHARLLWHYRAPHHFRLSSMSAPELRPEPVRQAQDWSPSSWQSRAALQQPCYRDLAALEAAKAELATLPPLVTSWEIFELKRQLAEAQDGKRFLLQGGDCAESFADCESSTLR